MLRAFKSFPFLCLLMSLHVAAQNQPDVQALIKKMTADLRAGKSTTLNQNLLYQAANAASALQALQPYCRDSAYVVRAKAFHLTAGIGQKTTNSALRQQSVVALLQGCQDRESGIVGTCSKALQGFAPADFNASARQQLGGLLVPGVAHLNNLVQLAGYVGEPAYEGTLQSLLLQPKLSKKDKWAVQLALARMGNPEVLARVVARVKSVPVNDDMVYEAAPALVYVRQPAGMAYLFEIMMSDNRNCESANPDSDEKILCAYRVLESIAPVIKDFPLKLDESGDLDVKDYPAALQTARSWYNGHQNSYALIKDTF